MSTSTSSLMSALEACDLLRFASVFSDRLGQAEDILAARPELARELGWVKAGQALVTEAAAQGPALLDRARGLPELPELRAEHAGAAQNEWVDGLEKLLAGITFHVSARAPIIEALFPHQKLVTLRKASRDVAQKFWADFEKRQKTSYVTRMLTSEDFAFAVPVMDRIRAAYAAWQGCFGDGGLQKEEANALRKELAEAGAAVERAVKQARLLAEASLVPLAGAYESTGLAQKPKRRVSKPLDVAPDAPSESDASAEEDESLVAEADEAAALAEEPEAPAEAATEPAPQTPAEEPPRSEATSAPAPEKVKKPRAPKKKKAAADAGPSADNQASVEPQPQE